MLFQAHKKGGFLPMVLDCFTAALSLLLKIFTVWFFLTALLFWKRPEPYARCTAKTRFACLIPARNEEAVIGALVESLKAQNYPAELYDVYVIPNNCTDGTEEAARSAGAKILRCSAPVRCKGDALRETIQHLLPQGYDAFCVFDADNVVHPDFLARMNDAFCAGAKVAKARQFVKNPRDSWVAGCYALYFALTDYFFNRSRFSLNLSAKLIGTGFAVHRDVLARTGGWNTVTITEDVEFAAQCAELGERIWWVPEAMTFDEAPTSFRVSLRQRRRWCSGIMSTSNIMLPRLLRPAPAANRFRAADMCFLLCAPFVQAFSLLPFPLFALCAAQHELLGVWAAFTLASLAASYIASAVFGFILARLSGEGSLARSALMFPIFMASFIPLQIISLLRRTTQWQEIRHERDCSASAFSRQIG